MVSGGIKVTVRNGKIIREDVSSRISPFIRIKVGSRLADSKKLSLESSKGEISWNQSLSLIFKNQTQLHIHLLDADNKIPHFQNQIGVCVLNLEVLSINLKQDVFAVFHNNGKLSALLQLEVFYETILEEKIEAAFLELQKPEVLENVSYQEQQHPVYETLQLKLKVLEATITHNTEAMGDMKPYCLVKIRQKGEHKTDILTGKNPKFNQTFIFDDVKETMVLELSLWDKETMKKDDYIGGTTVNVRSLMGLEATVKDFPIRYNDGKMDKPAGTIRCQFNLFS